VTVATLGAAHFKELSELDAIQYEQREPGKLLLKVATHNELSREWVHRLAEAVERKTQGGCEVWVQRVDAIPRTPRGKQMLLIQHLDVSAYLGAATVAGMRNAESLNPARNTWRPTR
jgi:phenylacetate-CoA ligase